MSAPPAAHRSPALLELTAVCKRYNVGQPNEAEVLHGVSFNIAPGELVALIGPSGSGKSTLLNILGLLERMTSGSYRIEGQEMVDIDDEALTLQRRTKLGFVFQFHHLLPAFTALENVTLPALMREGRVTSRQLERARAMLDAVGLGHAMDKRPGELSGGMQQRVAIARAMVLEPPMVLADEPTGNLDTASSDEVFALMRRMHAERNTSFLVVTHDPRLAARCDRVLELVDGRLVRDQVSGAAGGSSAG
ncbi:ABC transporter ATP-binding protein [Hydrogenophaga pseudoflava]|uniref:Lipoprotein-releasing system ATP-binding protein LolD n=1 Tax=Hydrogenophaga pseudoflava TaxID=47421 RepID=A0A4P6WZB3_HYDPS|nr:ABC transporter ATP-binding protein [Hydrogenophaga pseudoflava]QBM29060.1 Lipoprotein-releasing system ATP-binding protein LolD [Hydrogenophaga pseudoflava]